MGIEKGRDLGRVGPVPADAPTVPDDHDLAVVISRAIDLGSRPTIILTGGDIFRTLGGSVDRTAAAAHDDGAALHIPIDIGIATIDSGSFPFAAHVITGRMFGTGWSAVMNAQFVDGFDLGPRSHPSDGLFDITVGTLGWRQRRLALRRARSGTHLPHPGLTTSRSPSWTFRLDTDVPVRIDGIDRGRTRTVSVECIPDAAEVVLGAALGTGDR